MTAVARHRISLLAAALLAASSSIAVATAAPAQAVAAGHPRLVFVRCSAVPYPCAAHTIVTRTGHLLVGAGGMSRRAKVEFAVRASSGRMTRKAVGGHFRTATRIVVPIPGNAVSGGVRVVNPGHRYSNALRVTVRRPPPPPRSPGGPSGAASAFDGNGMWIWYLSKSQGGDPAAIAAQARAHGVGTVYVKSADGVNVWSQFSSAAVAALKATGLRVCAWQFVYGSDPAGEAQAGAVAAQNGADCFVIDAEGAYEGKYAQAQTYMTTLRTLVGASFPIALTSFPYVDFHPSLPYSVFMAPGNATFNLPQDYWKTIGDPVQTSLAHTYEWNAPYAGRIFPLGQTYDSPRAADVVTFRQLSAAWGARGVSWWDWQETGAAAWTAVGSPLDPLTAPPPPAPPTLAAGSGGKVGSRGDLVVWAQEHLAGAGESVTVDGQYGDGTAAATRAFQSGAGLPVTGAIDAGTWPALLRTTPAMVDWVARAKANAKAKQPAMAARAASSARGLPAGANGPASASLPARRYEIPPGPRGG
jgi:Putative peptidoglycan binding domain